MENYICNCHDLSGFTPEKCVRFKRVRQGDKPEEELKKEVRYSLV
jgi:hypothetical protein